MCTWYEPKVEPEKALAIVMQAILDCNVTPFPDFSYFQAQLDELVEARNKEKLNIFEYGAWEDEFYGDLFDRLIEFYDLHKKG